LSNGTAIAGQTAATYVVAEGVENTTITVMATSTDADGNPTSAIVTSAPTVSVTDKPMTTTITLNSDPHDGPVSFNVAFSEAVTPSTVTASRFSLTQSGGPTITIVSVVEV